MKSRYFLMATVVLTGCSLCYARSIQVTLKAQYGKPAENWESEALPIGNGHMGAMIFGGVAHDVIQTNEKTLWSGGPGEDANYDGGHKNTPEEAHAALQGFRRELQRRMNEFDNSKYLQTGVVDDAKDYNNDGFYDPKWENDYFVNHMLGTKEHFGSFQTLSDIHIEDPSGCDVYADYVRTLDIDNAIQSVNYTQNGIHYDRTYFMSYLDNVMVVRLAADKPFSRSISLKCPHSDKEISVSDGSITLTGWPTPVSGNKKRENPNWKDALSFAQVVSVHNTDGNNTEDTF